MAAAGARAGDAGVPAGRAAAEVAGVAAAGAPAGTVGCLRQSTVSRRLRARSVAFASRCALSACVAIAPQW